MITSSQVSYYLHIYNQLFLISQNKTKELLVKSSASWNRKIFLYIWYALIGYVMFVCIAFPADIRNIKFFLIVILYILDILITSLKNASSLTVDLEHCCSFDGPENIWEKAFFAISLLGQLYTEKAVGSDFGHQIPFLRSL